MHVQREFLISSAASDPEVHWAGRAHTAASTRIEAIAPSHRAAQAAKERRMKLSRTVGLAVAISLVAGTMAALVQIGGAAPAGPTGNVVDADVSLVKPLLRTEQFEKRAHAVPPSLSETTHGPWHERSNGL